ncbi:MAG TPA: secondary thiamine-phosphate synthase enzyme YjbQ [Actinomycetota bacterium]|jgi:secondary thiamine-phosphate synthase enzyme|nr:secondary thiamine-phosphate synthase enzyme YjbQ [Actinomycetota bacterium]
MTVLLENHSFQTTHCGQFLDITDDVREVVTKSGVQNGSVLVYSPHTTCSVVINESESGFVQDFCRLMDSLVPVDGSYVHDDLEVRTQNLEDDPHDIPNGWAHCRQSLIGSASQHIPVKDGEPLLGRWQRVFFLELDRSRDRKVFIQAMGE